MSFLVGMDLTTSRGRRVSSARRPAPISPCMPVRRVAPSPFPRVLAVDTEVCVSTRSTGLALSACSWQFGIQGTAYDVSEEVDDV